MEIFKKIGDAIETEWRANDYDESAFPALCADHLRKACLPHKYTPWQVLEWSLTQAELPRQRDIMGRFGEPPITIYSAPRFHIDVYFWFHGTTSTHQHGFCGAFQVMAGSSIHSWYEFDLKEKVNSVCEVGEMRLKSCGLLSTGDVQEILPGRQYIHSLFHLDHPSVSIVVRTDRSPLSQPQFDYQKPGLAVDPFFEHETILKKTQAIGALLRAKRDNADELIAKLIADSDFHTAYMYLSFLHGQLAPSGVEKMFGQNESRKRFDVFLSIVEEKHPAQGDILRRVFAHREFLFDLIRRRSVAEDPQHRFFFALLLNVEGKDRVLELVRERFPEVDPVEKVLDWTYELSQLRITGPQNQNALGIAPFDDVDQQLVEYLLRGRSDGEIADIIRETYPPEKAEQVLPALGERIATIKGSTVFSPLLAGS